MTLVVDASVACKWFVEEAGSAAAERLLSMGRALIAPDLVVPEVCNALWRKSTTGEISSDQLSDSVDDLVGFYDDLVPTMALAARATAMASTMGHPVYDCFYVALAERLGSQLVTADKELMKRLSRTDWSSLAIMLVDAESVLGQPQP